MSFIWPLPKGNDKLPTPHQFLGMLLLASCLYQQYLTCIYICLPHLEIDGVTGLTAVVMLEDGSDVIQVDRDAIKGMVLYRGTQLSSGGTIEVENWERIDFRDQTWLDQTGKYSCYIDLNEK